MKRHFLSKKDREQLLLLLEKKLKISSLPESVEVMEDEETKCYIFNGTPAICILDNEPIPLLKWLLKSSGQKPSIPRIVVNMGAVKPIANGADLMAPGIVKIEGSFPKGSIVLVVEEEKGIPIAVMRSLLSSEEVSSMKKGKVAENIHHIGDKLWKEL
ncbi:MAG: DUF1947 domain-containing protein [Fervidicoccaceae archaeon]